MVFRKMFILNTEKQEGITAYEQLHDMHSINTIKVMESRIADGKGMYAALENLLYANLLRKCEGKQLLRNSSHRWKLN
jgi:hypothetical protein